MTNFITGIIVIILVIIGSGIMPFSILYLFTFFTGNALTGFPFWVAVIAINGTLYYLK